MSDCQCGGGYGDGPDRDGAHLEGEDCGDRMWLLPAKA